MWLTLRIIPLILLIASVVGLASLRLSGAKILSVQTGSMLPAFAPGDALLVSPASSANLKPGEVISYHDSRNPNLTISHRLTSIDPKNGWLTTKGDNLAAPDPSFSSSLLIGRATTLLPGFGTVMDYPHSPLGLGLTIYLPALLFLVSEVYRLSRAYTRPLYSARL